MPLLWCVWTTKQTGTGGPLCSWRMQSDWGRSLMSKVRVTCTSWAFVKTTPVLVK